MENNNEYEILTTVLTQQYGIRAGHTERVRGNLMNRFYSVTDTTGEQWEAYVSRADGLADTVYTTWMSGYGGYSLPDFQLSRAGILVHLEAEQYPRSVFGEHRTEMCSGITTAGVFCSHPDYHRSRSSQYMQHYMV